MSVTMRIVTTNFTKTPIFVRTSVINILPVHVHQGCTISRNGKSVICTSITATLFGALVFNNNAALYSRINNVQPTERSPGASNPNAKSRDNRDNAVRLCHVEPTRVSLRHATPNPSQLPDSLRRLAKNNSADHKFAKVSGHAYKDGKRLYAGGGSCSRDLWRTWGIRDCRSA